MNYNDTLIRNALLGELSAAQGLGAKAMTEKILLGLHYRKGADEWFKAREAIDSEECATDEVKADALAQKLMEDCGITERRMSRAAFEQVVEAVLPLGMITSVLAARENSDAPGKLPAEVWLGVFAEQLVDNTGI